MKAPKPPRTKSSPTYGGRPRARLSGGGLSPVTVKTETSERAVGSPLPAHTRYAGKNGGRKLTPEQARAERMRGQWQNPKPKQKRKGK